MTGAAQMVDDGTRYVLTLDAPGVRQEDVEVVVTGQRLSVTAHAELPEREGQQAVRRERQAWRFEQAFELSQPVAADGVTASLVDGRLQVIVPKVEVAAPRRVTIATGVAPITPSTDHVLWQLRGPAAPLDVFTNDAGYEVVIDVPGVNVASLELELERAVLTVHHREGDARHALRSLRVPEDVDADSVRADLDAGVLTLRLPRLASALPRRIPVAQA